MSTDIFPHFAHSRRSLVLLVLTTVLFASGCASKYGPQTTAVNHYPACYQPIEELRKAEDMAARSAIFGGILGAVVGAGAGALTGKDWKAIVAGAGIGAAAGAAGGYAYGDSKKREDDKRVLAEYMSQLDKDIGVMSREVAAARVARSCYERQFASALSDFKAGKLSQDGFSSRTEEIVAGMEEVSRIIGNAGREGEAVAREYRNAVEKRAQAMDVAISDVPRTSASPVASSGTGKRPGKSPSKNTKANQILATQEGKQLTQLVAQADNIQSISTDAKSEEQLLLKRIAATRQTAKDAMS